MNLLFYFLTNGSQNGMTPLLYACKQDFVEVAKLLLKIENIDLNIKDKVFIFILFIFIFLFFLLLFYYINSLFIRKECPHYIIAAKWILLKLLKYY